MLEWHMGDIAVAIDHPAIAWEDIARLGADRVPDSGLLVQPGLRYLRGTWPVDDLMKLYLTNTAPDQLSLEATDVWLEVRGARGDFSIVRLEADDFAFRTSIAAGRSIGAAAEAALAVSAAFDPGRALQSLVVDGVATDIAVRGDQRS